jgi:hypothetical protein
VNVTGSTFSRNGGASENASIQVNSGGHLIANNATFSIDNLYLYSASTDQLTANVLATVLNVNSGASINITGNDFSNGTVVASGTSTATINLNANYWGTTNTTLIENRITDHHVNANLPTVSISSPLSAANPPGAATTIVATSTAATFSASASQSVTLSASLTSGSIKPTAGTVTFVLVSGTAMIGNPVTATVNSSGVASTTILLPAGTLGGTDKIVAIFNGTANFDGSIDVSHTVTVNPAAVTNTAASASDTYNASGAQMVNLSATITSAGGTVNEGTETFTILTGSTPVGSPVTVSVVNGVAAASYTVPAGTHANTYTIEAAFSGTADFKPATDLAHVLTIAGAATTTASVNTSTTYSAAAQTVTLQATVTSAAGTVNEGTETFTIFNGSAAVAGSVSVPISSGIASTPYTLPAGLAGATYTIKAVYDGGQDYKTSTDTAHTLTVNPAATATAAANQTTTFSSAAQIVTLTAAVTSSVGTVGEGSVTFTVLNGATVIGTATKGAVAGGTASVSYTIPASEPANKYTIKAAYSGTAEFLTSMDTAHFLTISAAPAGAAVAVLAPPSTSGVGTSSAPPSLLAALVPSTAAVARKSSSGHKLHGSSKKINRGPLAISRPAAVTHRRSAQKLVASERRSEVEHRLSRRR